MKVISAEHCGFCPGVKNAIRMAEKILAEQDDVYSLGPVIHNRDEVDRLAKAGLKTVHSVEQIDSGMVLIRSHGAAPSQIEKLREKKLKIADATCVLVKRLQRIARQLEKQGYKVVMIGDKKHPEVQAVVGCGKKIAVVGGNEDMEKLPKRARLGIVCQTTQTRQHFGSMVKAITERDFIELKIVDTLCKEAIKRQNSAVKLCKTVDVMFVLGGLESANTRKLAELCKKYNSQTFHLQNWKEFDKSMVSGKKTAGITAGASTPDWIINEFVENITAFNNQTKDG